MPRPLLALLAAGLVALAGCGGDDEPERPQAAAPATTQAAPPPAATAPGEEPGPAGGAGARYPQDARRAFLQACEAEPGATRAACACALERIEARYSFEAFRRIDRAAARGERTPAELTRIARACGRETARPDGDA
jgi:hypothetical protein